MQPTERPECRDPTRNLLLREQPQVAELIHKAAVGASCIVAHYLGSGVGSDPKDTGFPASEGAANLNAGPAPMSSSCIKGASWGFDASKMSEGLSDPVESIVMAWAALWKQTTAPS